jgi:hypothetical protein
MYTPLINVWDSQNARNVLSSGMINGCTRTVFLKYADPCPSKYHCVHIIVEKYSKQI